MEVLIGFHGNIIGKWRIFPSKRLIRHDDSRQVWELLEASRHESSHGPLENELSHLIGGDWLPSIFYFPIYWEYIGNLIIPIDELLFFRGIQGFLEKL